MLPSFHMKPQRGDRRRGTNDCRPGGAGLSLAGSFPGVSTLGLANFFSLSFGLYAGGK